MTWDNRGYYYRSIKRQGRVTREYFGKGLAADLAAQLDEIERHDRDEKRAASNAERQRLIDLDGNLDRLNVLADAAVFVALEDAGFHRHKGQWRKRRAQDAAQ